MQTARFLRRRPRFGPSPAYISRFSENLTCWKFGAGTRPAEIKFGENAKFNLAKMCCLPGPLSFDACRQSAIDASRGKGEVEQGVLGRWLALALQPEAVARAGMRSRGVHTKMSCLGFVF